MAARMPFCRERKAEYTGGVRKSPRMVRDKQRLTKRLAHWRLEQELEHAPA